MAKRRNLGGRYVNTRERDSKKGKKGTIMGNWSSGKKDSTKNKGFWASLFGFGK
jgi:hypothetical protein